MEVCPALTISAGFDPNGPARTVEQAGYAWSRLAEDGALHPVQSETARDVATIENWIALPR